ncbi:MAG: selenocysteine-specific translation elongation factor [Acidobacteriia bacterium]|nr:selenocysteine-specific translation elongation factor [Terriglobia bacterium]
MKHVIVGTAGHIDHGKSALVRALTGTDPDRLEEEKRRGITIDLGFAHFDLGEDLRIGFIDVPGHERFVKNMLAGVGGIDLVLLVVAADESIKPQTREHFDICRLLGIQRGLVAITKSDLVEADILDLVRLEIQEFVGGSFLEGAPVIPVSARTGEGLDALKAELRRLSQAIPPRPVELPFRLPIDRAFVMKGFGAVVTGTLVAGRIEKEAQVEIFPLGRRLRVRGMEVHNAPAQVALAGQRTALNVVGIEAKEIARGMVLAPPETFEATTRLDARLNLLPTARPLKNHSRVHFHCGTAEMLAEVVLLEGKDLKPGQTALAQMRLSEAGLFLPGDRFIIRQFSPVTTMGGGIVLDNQPSKHRVGDARVSEFLGVMEAGDSKARLEGLLREKGEYPIPSLGARLGWQPAEILRVARMLEVDRRVLLLGQPASVLVHAEHFQGLAKQVVEQLEKFHAANPLVPGLSKEDLRARAGANGVIPSPLLFNALLLVLTEQRKVNVQGETVRLAGREVQLTSQEAAAKEQISAAFEKAALAVPSAQEVIAALAIDRGRASKLVQILLKENVLTKVTEDLIFHHSALTRLREVLARRKTQNNRINVAAFKELTGLSRKYAIPLLEYLDRERVTRREGDDRIIL